VSPVRGRDVGNSTRSTIANAAGRGNRAHGKGKALPESPRDAFSTSVTPSRATNAPILLWDDGITVNAPGGLWLGREATDHVRVTLPRREAIGR
jgi:hypothetical protein